MKRFTIDSVLCELIPLVAQEQKESHIEYTLDEKSIIMVKTTLQYDPIVNNPLPTGETISFLTTEEMK